MACNLRRARTATSISPSFLRLAFVAALVLVLTTQTTPALGSGAATTAARAATTRQLSVTKGFASGVYVAPAGRGVAGAASFDAAFGVSSSSILDFEGDASWSEIEGPSWLLTPHSGESARLELSVPLLPAHDGGTLADCAAGRDNSHWKALAANLVAAHLASTIVRPGWEFNGNWYRWSAIADPAAFAGCFRHLVTSMRSVHGQAFAFDWNVNVNLNTATARAAWPGSAYVTFVGVDAYDMSWSNYAPGTTPTVQQQQATTSYLMDGVGGLRYWSSFAASHGVSFAVPEWAVTWRSDGHGGGDDPSYVAAMFHAFQGAGLARKVAYEHYFDTSGTSTDHAITGTTRFPLSAAQFRTQLQAAI